jgi:hypothetical protein
VVLIATTDAKLAQRLGAAILDEKRYLLKAATAKAFRHEVYSEQPDVLLLDVTFGGNAYRVIESVPRLIDTTSRPAVVLLIPWSSEKVEREAAVAGCYDVVNVDGPALKRRVAKAVAAAFAAREAGEVSSQLSRRVVH